MTTPGTTVCSICLDLLGPSQGLPAPLDSSTAGSSTSNSKHDAQSEIAYLSGCSHNYHDQCISVWANTSNTCPTCRARFGEITVRSGLDGDIVRTYPVADKRAPSVYYPESRAEISAAIRDNDRRVFHGPFSLGFRGLNSYTDFRRLRTQRQNDNAEPGATARDPTNLATAHPVEHNIQNHSTVPSFQAHCQICGTSEQASLIATCPGCQYSFHPACLQEGQEEAGGTPRATEDWFMCPSCNITTFVRNLSAGGVVALDEIMLAREHDVNDTGATTQTRLLRSASRRTTETTRFNTNSADYYETNDDYNFDFSDFVENLVDFDEYEDDNSDEQDQFMQTSHHTGAVHGGTLRLTSSFIPARGPWTSNRSLRDRAALGRRRRNGTRLNANRSQPEPAILLDRPTSIRAPQVEAPQLPEEEVLSWRLFEQARAASERDALMSSPLLLPQLPNSSSTTATSQVSTFPTPGAGAGAGAGDGAGAGLGTIRVDNNNPNHTNMSIISDVSSTASSSGRDIHRRGNRTGSRAGGSPNNSTVPGRAMEVRESRTGEQQRGGGGASGCIHEPPSVEAQSTASITSSGTRTTTRYSQTSSGQDSRGSNSGTTSGSSSDSRNRVCKKLKRPGRRRPAHESGSSEQAGTESCRGSQSGQSTRLTESSSNVNSGNAEPTQIQMLLNSIRQPSAPSVIFNSNGVNLSSSVSMTNLTTTENFTLSPSPSATTISGSLSAPAATLSRSVKMTPPSSPPPQKSRLAVLLDSSPPPSLLVSPQNMMPQPLSRSASEPQSSTVDDVEMSDARSFENSACGSSSTIVGATLPLGTYQSHGHFNGSGSSSNHNDQPSHKNHRHHNHIHGQRHKRSAPPLSAKDKSRLQELVRDVLRPLYRAGEVTKTEYTEINKCVSRAMYRRVFNDKVVSTRRKGSNSEDYEKMEVTRCEEENESDEEERDTEDQKQENGRQLEKTRSKIATVYVLKYTPGELTQWKELASEYVERERTRRRAPGSTSATSGSVTVAGPL